jgi:hypothetical protein
MGIVDYARIPKRPWYWYRYHQRQIPPPAWPRPGRPARLRLTADRTTLDSADGTDDLHIIVTFVDDEGSQVSATAPLTMTIESGPGEFATGRRIRFVEDDPAADGLCAVRDGQAAAFFRSYHRGTTRIRATSPGLDDAVIDLETTSGPPLIGASPVPFDRAAANGSITAYRQRERGELSLFGRDNPTKASSYRPGHPPKHVNDGSPATTWMPLPGDQDAWVAIDLERLVTVSQVRLEFPTQVRPRFVIEVSCDPSTWTVITDVADHARPLADRTCRIAVPEVVARQVRVRIVATGDEPPPAVAELSVLGRL